MLSQVILYIKITRDNAAYISSLAKELITIQDSILREKLDFEKTKSVLAYLMLNFIMYLSDLNLGNS